MQNLSLELTPNAAKRIRSLAEKQGEPQRALRLAVDSGGCSGFQYKFDLVEAHKASAEDCVIERDGAKLVIDMVSLGFVRGSQLDFVSDLSGERFEVKNPQAESSCGCGSSFAMKLE